MVRSRNLRRHLDAAFLILMFGLWVWLKFTGRIEPGITREGLAGSIAITLFIWRRQRRREKREKEEASRRDDLNVEPSDQPKSLRRMGRR